MGWHALLWRHRCKRGRRHSYRSSYIPAPQEVPSCVLVTPPCLRPLSGQGQLEAPEGWGFTGSGGVPSVKTFVRVFDEKLLSAVQVTMACVGLLSYCAGAQG